MTTALEASSIVATNDVVANVSFGRCCKLQLVGGTWAALGCLRSAGRTAVRLGQTLSLLSGNVHVVEAIHT